MTKRLFIFAGYDKDNLIDDTLVDYLSFLSGAGDIILTMDCNIPAAQLKKLNDIKNLIYVSARRHGEYDFGSYKRGYQYARDKKLLAKYDWIYFANDSVYCVADPKAILEQLESRGAEFLGMSTHCRGNRARHFQSWFIGMSSRVARQKWFDDFIMSIEKMHNKEDIIMRYEIGTSVLMRRHNIKSTSIDEDILAGNDIYTGAMRFMNTGAPFIKKLALCYIHDINRLMPHVANMDILSHIDAASRRAKIMPRPNQYRLVRQVKVLGITMYSIIVKPDGSARKIKLFGIFTVAKIITP